MGILSRVTWGTGRNGVQKEETSSLGLLREVGSRPHVEQGLLGRVVAFVHSLGGREQRGACAGAGGMPVPRWKVEGVLIATIF